MKQALYFVLFLSLASAVPNRIHAQSSSVKCVDPDIQGRADNIKSSYEKQGKVIFQESMLGMTSMEPSPIAVRLQQGITYEMIFVGSNQASRMMLELFDGADKKLDHKVEKGASHLLYTFTPAKTEVYLVALTQKKGVKDLCGYFAIMVKKPAQSSPKVTPSKGHTPAVTPVKAVPKPNTAKPATTTKENALPANQRPNPNRTRATQQYQQQQKP